MASVAVSVAFDQHLQQKIEKSTETPFFDEVSSKSVISGLVSAGRRL